ncbi:MAG: GPR endopeptidase [Lachnospiraceae bacterium]|nr:GPR endopeptidase [Lachnospiraceae bacterium]
MNSEFKVRTDLAVELEEDISAKEGKVDGIEVIEKWDETGVIKITKVIVKNENGKKIIGRDIGSYITLESDELAYPDEGYHREMSIQIAKYVKELLPDDDKVRVMITGLGNREATPDSLGPRVVDNMLITRSILEDGNKYEISAVAPGVMAQTGMEAQEIIKGIVEEVDTDILIVVDSLAARNINRLNTTIQISDTGIMPGSGVGNHRKGITLETIGIPVIAIGVPTVVDAATIVNDTLENLLEALQKIKLLGEIKMMLDEFTSEEKYKLIKEVAEPKVSEMYVTTKDVDATIKYLGYTISEGLNIIWDESI